MPAPSTALEPCGSPPSLSPASPHTHAPPRVPHAAPRPQHGPRAPRPHPPSSPWAPSWPGGSRKGSPAPRRTGLYPQISREQERIPVAPPPQLSRHLQSMPVVVVPINGLGCARAEGVPRSMGHHGSCSLARCCPSPPSWRCGTGVSPGVAGDYRGPAAVVAAQWPKIGRAHV